MLYGIVIKGEVEPIFIHADKPNIALQIYLESVYKKKFEVVKVDKEKSNYCVILLDGKKTTKNFYDIITNSKPLKKENTKRVTKRELQYPEPNKKQLQADNIIDRLKSYEYCTSSQKVNPIAIRIDGRIMSILYRNIEEQEAKKSLYKYVRQQDLSISKINARQLGKEKDDLIELNFNVYADNILKKCNLLKINSINNAVLEVCTNGLNYPHFLMPVEPKQQIIVKLDTQNDGITIKENENYTFKNLTEDKGISFLFITIPDYINTAEKERPIIDSTLVIYKEKDIVSNGKIVIDFSKSKGWIKTATFTYS